MMSRFYVLTQNEKAPDAVLLSAAGNQWAKRAEYLLLANFGKITVQRLMVINFQPCDSSTVSN